MRAGVDQIDGGCPPVRPYMTKEHSLLDILRSKSQNSVESKIKRRSRRLFADVGIYSRVVLRQVVTINNGCGGRRQNE